MHRTKGGNMPPQSHDRGEMHRAIVAELASVVDHVRKSLTLMETAIASEAAVEETIADNIIVLDDVTPGYARAHATLRDCDARLGLALRLLQGPVSPDVVLEAGQTSEHWPISA